MFVRPHNSDRRPDILQISGWNRVTYDLTITNSLAPSNLSRAKQSPGHHLEQEERDKAAHHAQGAQDHNLVFIPVALDRLGGFGNGASSFLMQLAQIALDNGQTEPQYRQLTQDTRQRLAMSVARTNYNIYREYAAAVRRHLLGGAQEEPEQGDVGDEDV